MTTCPTSGAELDKRIIETAKEAGSTMVKSSSSLGMVLRSGKVLGGMKGGVKKCSLVGLTLCSVLFIAAAWTAYTGCNIGTPVLIDFINRAAPGATDNLVKVGVDVATFITSQFEGICLIVRAQMKMKGQDAFKVIFDEITKSTTTMFAFGGAVAGISSIVSRTLQLTSNANNQLQTIAMEICERGGFTIGEDDVSSGAAAAPPAAPAPAPAPAAAAPPVTAPSRAAAAPTRFTRRTPPPSEAGYESEEYHPSGGGLSKRRKNCSGTKKGKKSMRGGRRLSIMKSKRNKK
jgi:hypothetical protein